METLRFQHSDDPDPKADGKPFMDNHGHWGYDASALSSDDENERVNRQLARFTYIRNFLGLYFLDKLGEPAPVRSTMGRHLDILARLLRFAHSNRLTLSLSLSPGHAEHWASIVESGIQDDLEWWMRKVVSINHDVARQFKQSPYPLFNFAGVHEYSSVPVPTENRPDSLNPYFNDTLHFSTTLGDKILAIITRGCDRAPKSGFGQCLGQGNIERVISRMRKELEAYISSDTRVHIKRL